MIRYTSLERVSQDLRTPTSAVGAWADGGEFLDTVTACIESAETLIDLYCGRTFTAAGGDAETRRVVGTGSDVLLTDDYMEITQIRADDPDDGEIIETDDWAVEIMADAHWPARHVRYRRDRPDWARSYGYASETLLGGVGGWRRGTHYHLTGRWGWPETPAPISLAASLQATRYFHRRSAPLGVMTMEMGGMYVPRLDGDVSRLLAPYCTGGFAGR